MVKLDDLDTSFLVPCKRCKELLQESERVCPFCGKDQTSGDEPVTGVIADAVEAPPSLAGSAFTDAGFDRTHHDGRASPAARPNRRVLGVVVALALALGIFLVLDPLGLRAPGGAQPSPAVREVARPVQGTPATAPVATAAQPQAPQAPVAPEAPASPATQEGCSEALRALSLCPSP
jgi:hypothetical protein